MSKYQTKSGSERVWVLAESPHVCMPSLLFCECLRCGRQLSGDGSEDLPYCHDGDGFIPYQEVSS